MQDVCLTMAISSREGDAAGEYDSSLGPRISLVVKVNKSKETITAMTWKCVVFLEMYPDLVQQR